MHAKRKFGSCGCSEISRDGREAKKHPTGIEPVTSGSAIPHSTTELWMPQTLLMDIWPYKMNIVEMI